MALKIYNTFSKKKETFKPLKDKIVGIYTCGPTVYDFVHIGNLRTYAFQDVLIKYLRSKGFKIRHVMNITDIEDKTIKAAKKNGVSLESHTQKFTNYFLEHISLLNIQKPRTIIKATDMIYDIVGDIKKLMDEGFAYKASDKSIYFNLAKFKKYGWLSKIDRKNLRPCERIKKDEYEKEDACDFVLWRAWTKKDGNVFWDTEIGKGRPGWHIECSAIAQKYIGPSLDIHSGGIDLVFPHHENEIAQSESLTGQKFAKYWVHGEHLLVDNQKMAKSSKNYYTMLDIELKVKNPLALRYLFLTTSYRDKLNFTFDSLIASEEALNNLYDFLYRLGGIDNKLVKKPKKINLEPFKKQIEKAMDNDLDTPKALSVLFTMIKKVNILLNKNQIKKQDAKKVHDYILKLDQVLGIIGKEYKKRYQVPQDVKDLAIQREHARAKEDWAHADSLRDVIEDKGFEIEDTPNGYRIKRIIKKTV